MKFERTLVSVDTGAFIASPNLTGQKVRCIRTHKNSLGQHYIVAGDWEGARPVSPQYVFDRFVTEEKPAE